MFNPCGEGTDELGHRGQAWPVRTHGKLSFRQYFLASWQLPIVARRSPSQLRAASSLIEAAARSVRRDDIPQPYRSPATLLPIAAELPRDALADVFLHREINDVFGFDDVLRAVSYRNDRARNGYKRAPDMLLASGILAMTKLCWLACLATCKVEP